MNYIIYALSFILSSSSISILGYKIYQKLSSISNLKMYLNFKKLIKINIIQYK
jgi:hypothetical protein